MALRLTSPAFDQGGEIPKRYIFDGAVSVSPPLRWEGAPRRHAELRPALEGP
jgi:phosphatidylethanolamine-binding protein (PEBP) family uncharacterized protein